MMLLFNAYMVIAGIIGFIIWINTSIKICQDNINNDWHDIVANGMFCILMLFFVPFTGFAAPFVLCSYLLGCLFKFIGNRR